MEQNTIEKVVSDMSENHHKIIDDWCKAYLAQLYEEGVDIKPGCFSLMVDENVTLHEGTLTRKYRFVKND